MNIVKAKATLSIIREFNNRKLIAKLQKSNDALLEACKNLLAITVRSGLDNGKNTDSDICNDARNAIKQVEVKNELEM